MKIKRLLLCLILVGFQCHAGFEQHYRKLENKTGSSQIRNIDFLYLINLDQRPERLANAVEQLSAYDLHAQRFPAIYGWRLPASVFNDVGVKYAPGMWPGREHVLHFPLEWNGSCKFVGLNDSCYGFTFFNGWTTHGAIGCTLSHLSVLQDAYDAGYETIWVLEDDFAIVRDPREVSERIDELDALVGDWDVLYTDFDCLNGLDLSRDLLDQMPYKWRPDMPDFDLYSLLERTEVGDHFTKIGSRLCTYSMIIRRAGMKKILDFYQTHHIFMPYDHEIAFVPGILLYTMKDAIVTTNSSDSDTKDLHF